MIPLILVVMGLSWILASLGVFLRDVGQIISLLVTVMMFLSPIFYPVSALPEGVQRDFVSESSDCGYRAGKRRPNLG